MTPGGRDLRPASRVARPPREMDEPPSSRGAWEPLQYAQRQYSLCLWDLMARVNAGMRLPPTSGAVKAPTTRCCGPNSCHTPSVEEGITGPQDLSRISGRFPQ